MPTEAQYRLMVEALAGRLDLYLDGQQHYECPHYGEMPEEGPCGCEPGPDDHGSWRCGTCYELDLVDQARALLTAGRGGGRIEEEDAE